MTVTKSDPAPEPATPARGKSKTVVTDRSKAERSLGWRLAAPAFVIMVAVTAYPILQAIWNSFFNYRLTDPANKKFTFLGNYIVALSDGIFWKATLVTVIITVITVAVELVVGFTVAMVMHKIVVPRRSVRTTCSSPTRSSPWSRRSVALRLPHRHRLHQPLVLGVPGTTSTPTGSWLLGLDLRHLPLGDLEDDPLHVAAAPRRTGPGRHVDGGGGRGRRRHPGSA